MTFIACFDFHSEFHTTFLIAFENWKYKVALDLVNYTAGLVYVLNPFMYPNAQILIGSICSSSFWVPLRVNFPSPSPLFCFRIN